MGGGEDFDVTSSIVIKITDISGLVEGQTVTAVCNGKTFSGTMEGGVCMLTAREIGIYTITAGEYSTTIICPYWGGYGTDIYSGSLQVTCMKEDGVGKTCNVRSCDDNYEFTDNYNLTQTFDNTMQLAYLGIPTGKYIITVDGKYRFFKEIETIQSVNTAEVELKQWLFKDGDQCVHNTGGWMKCYVGGYSTSKQINAQNSWGISNSEHRESAQLLSDALKIDVWAVAYAKNIGSYYWRVPANSYATIGTIKEHPIEFCRYGHCILAASGGTPIVSLRSGAANGSNTSVNTATIMRSGRSKDIDVGGDTGIGYIVVGDGVSHPEIGYHAGYADSVSYSSDITITQIYLI